MDRNFPHPLIPVPKKTVTNTPASNLVIDGPVSVITNASGAQQPADYLTAELNALDVATTAAAEGTAIALELTSENYAPNADGVPGIEAETYRLTVTDTGVEIVSSSPAGLQHGATTLLQLLIADGATWQIPPVTIEDAPRYAWRGLSFDLARSFSPLVEIKEVVDVLVELKYNVLHLHLCDDQGWRLQIRSHPELTTVSGQTAVEGGRSGFLTQEEYRELVEYAADRHVLIVPEIDVPGHTHALLHALPLADVGRTAPDPYTGIDVGFSELRLDDPTALSVLTDILTEVAELTPGPWIHVGGDEPFVIPAERYVTSVAAVEKLVYDIGKKAIGWNEFVRGAQRTETVIQHWNPRTELAALTNAARRGHRVIMSPASHVYLDMQYTADHPYGQDWAGLIEVADSYEWEPSTNVPDLDADQIMGIEAAIWMEKIHTREAVLEMLLPRLAPIAEVAWSLQPQHPRKLDQVAERLAAQATRWERKGWPFYRSQQVQWPAQ